MKDTRTSTLIEQLAFAISQVGDAEVNVAYDGFDAMIPYAINFNIIGVTWTQDAPEDERHVTIVLAHNEGTHVR